MVSGLETVNRVSNDGEFHCHAPFMIQVTIQGTCDLLFHRWSCDDVEAKAKAAKGSRAKKEDNVESYVYRDNKQQICMPGRYLQRSTVEAARNHQDPRSSRKAAKDLVAASVRVGPLLSPILVQTEDKYVPCKNWQYLDKARVVIQRAAVTRIRPAFVEGWQAKFELLSL